MPVKLEYAFNSTSDHSLVHVSSVANGLACDCICPHCGANLVAKNKATNKIKAHFQHYQSVECTYAVETSLHLLAKEVLDESRKIMLPGYKERFLVKDKKYRGWGPLYDEEKEFLVPEVATIDKVQIEKSLESIRPDLLVWINDQPIMVEIYVTHKVDEVKLGIIKQRDTPVIEVDLHSIDRTITREDLTSILLSDQFSNWIHHPVIELAKQDFQMELDTIVQEEEARRDQEYAIIMRKRDRKKHKVEYLDKAKRWCRSKSDSQLLKIEEKHGYSIFKRVSENWIDGCPIARNQTVSRCLFCEYNPKFDSSSKSRFIRPNDTQLGFIRCLFDLMKDRYYNQDRDYDSAP